VTYAQAVGIYILYINILLGAHTEPFLYPKGLSQSCIRG
jgi:hypothetical protein